MPDPAPPQQRLLPHIGRSDWNVKIRRPRSLPELRPLRRCERWDARGGKDIDTYRRGSSRLVRGLELDFFGQQNEDGSADLNGEEGQQGVEFPYYWRLSERPYFFHPSSFFFFLSENSIPGYACVFCLFSFFLSLAFTAPPLIGVDLSSQI